MPWLRFKVCVPRDRLEAEPGSATGRRGSRLDSCIRCWGTNVSYVRKRWDIEHIAHTTVRKASIRALNILLIRREQCNSHTQARTQRTQPKPVELPTLVQSPHIRCHDIPIRGIAIVMTVLSERVDIGGSYKRPRREGAGAKSSKAS